MERKEKEGKGKKKSFSAAQSSENQLHTTKNITNKEGKREREKPLVA
jgi:hypothetical protein